MAESVGEKGTRWRVGRVGPSALVAALLLLGTPAAAQKDYFNLDKNRPVRIEDAYATERYALEVKVAPLRVERERGGVYRWGFDPEVAYGILPRTSVELGFPFAFNDGGDEAERGGGLSGIELSAFHNLNIETRTVPALGIRADLTLPVGGLAGDGLFPSVTGIATRSFRWARLHANAQYTFGRADDDPSGNPPHESSRWLAGLAVDRVFPLSGYLLIADLHAQQPMHAADPVEWNAGTGIRYQVNPFLAVDAGLGRRITGDPVWYVTLGSAYHLGFRALIPGVR